MDLRHFSVLFPNTVFDRRKKAHGQKCIRNGAKFAGVDLRHQEKTKIAKRKAKFAVFPYGEGKLGAYEQLIPPRGHAAKAEAADDLGDHHMIPVDGSLLGTVNIGITAISKARTKEPILFYIFKAA